MDLIDREQAIAIIKDTKYHFDTVEDRAKAEWYLNSVPSAEKTGKWLIPQHRGVMSWNKKAYAECSVCHNIIFDARSMKYCPQCGAKMEVEE